MSDINRKKWLRVGAHASASDFSSTPGTLVFLRPDSGPTFADQGHNAIERDYQREDNENTAPLRGGQNVGMADFSDSLKGLSGSGAGDGVAASSLDTDLDILLSALAGSVDNSTGDTAAASQSGGASFDVDGSAAAGLIGDAYLIEGATSGKLQARRLISIGGATYGIGISLTEDDATAEAAAASAVCYGGRTYDFDPSVTEHTHVYFDAEGENWRRTYLGALGGANISFESGGLAKLNLSGWRCTSWVDEAEANPTYSAPTTGSEIVCLDSPMWIADGSTFTGTAPALMQAFDMGLDLGISVEPRRSDGGPNGHWGFVVTRKQPVLTGKLRFGTGTSPDEATDAFLGLLRGSTASDAPVVELMFQCGRSAGAACAVSMPAARITGTLAVDNGQQVIEFRAEATDPAQGPYVGSDTKSGCRLYVF